MKYGRAVVILLLVCAMIPLPGWAGAEEGAAARALAAGAPDQVFEQGSKTSVNGVHVVSLYGSWREMGRQYGALMRDELNEVYLFVQTIIEYSVGNAEKAESIMAVQTAQTPYRIGEFLAGASETSGLSVRQLQAVNAVERIGGLPKCSAAFCWGGLCGRAAGHRPQL